MTLKTTLAAAVLVLAPGLALAQGCSGYGHAMEQQAMSCMEGTQWNVETGTCVPVVTG